MVSDNEFVLIRIFMVSDPDHVYDDLRKGNERHQSEQRDERESGYVCLDPGKRTVIGTGKLSNGIQFLCQESYTNINYRHLCSALGLPSSIFPF